MAPRLPWTGPAVEPPCRFRRNAPAPSRPAGSPIRSAGGEAGVGSDDDALARRRGRTLQPRAAEVAGVARVPDGSRFATDARRSGHGRALAAQAGGTPHLERRRRPQIAGGPFAGTRAACGAAHRFAAGPAERRGEIARDASALPDGPARMAGRGAGQAGAARANPDRVAHVAARLAQLRDGMTRALRDARRAYRADEVGLATDDGV